MRKMMFLVVSLMLMVTPNHSKSDALLAKDCAFIEDQLNHWLSGLQGLFVQNENNAFEVYAKAPLKYDELTKMAERWANIYTAKCAVPLIKKQ